MIVLIENRLLNWLLLFFFHLLIRLPPILASVGNINGTKNTQILLNSEFFLLILRRVTINMYILLLAMFMSKRM